MPNHIVNILTAPKSVLDSLEVKDAAVDFNSLIPRPNDVPGDGVNLTVESLAKLISGHIPFPNGDSGSADGLLNGLQFSNAMRDLKDGGVSKLSDQDFEHFVSCVRSFRKHGAFYWYDWNCKHWGTKWNAYAAKRISETSVRFETAWSPPRPVIDKLAFVFPSSTIEHEWADEDIGSNYGHRIYKNSSGSNVAIVDGKRFANELWKRKLVRRKGGRK